MMCLSLSVEIIRATEQGTVFLLDCIPPSLQMESTQNAQHMELLELFNSQSLTRFLIPSVCDEIQFDSAAEVYKTKHSLDAVCHFWAHVSDLPRL
jgi:hypothetical protein